MSLEHVAKTGNRLDTLRALRDYLARALDETASARDQASLAARLSDVLIQIQELTPPSEEERDDIDDLLDDDD